MKHFLICIPLLLMMPLKASAQTDSIVAMSPDLTLATALESPKPMTTMSDTLQKWDFRLSLGSTIIGGRNLAASAFSVTPTVVFRPNERLKISASATSLNSYSLHPGGYNIRGREVRDLAPVRNPSANAVGISVAASYKVNDRLWIAASLMHIGGGLASAAIVNPWLSGVGPVMLDATAFSAAMRYRVGKKSYLDVHFTVIDDREGSFAPLYWGGPWGGYYGDLYGSAFNSPFSSYSFHGTLFDD